MTTFIESVNNPKSSHDVKGISKDEDFVSSFSNSVCSAYAVFDGHGGKYVARNLANGVEDIPSFCQYICDKFIEFDGLITIEDYIKQLFLEFDILLKKYHSGVVGSTATVCIIYQNNIYMAYVGDSKAMIVKDGSLVYQTLNHNCIENETELKRMQQANVVMSDSPNFVVKSDQEI